MSGHRTGPGRLPQRATTAAVLLTTLLLMLTGCVRSVDGDAVSTDRGSSASGDQGNVDTDQFDQLLEECALVRPEQIADAVGGSSAQSTFNGAICRWVVSGSIPSGVTFTWFESGRVQVEKDTAKRLGYTTENVRVSGVTAFTARDPARPGACGITANSPARGIYSWWVEPRSPTASAPDPCAAPTKLMELVLTGGQ